MILFASLPDNSQCPGRLTHLWCGVFKICPQIQGWIQSLSPWVCAVLSDVLQVESGGSADFQEWIAQGVTSFLLSLGSFPLWGTQLPGGEDAPAALQGCPTVDALGPRGHEREPSLKQALQTPSSLQLMTALATPSLRPGERPQASPPRGATAEFLIHGEIIICSELLNFGVSCYAVVDNWYTWQLSTLCEGSIYMCV